MTVVRVERGRNDVAVVTLANPPVNALSSALRQELQAALDELARSSIRALILTAAPGGPFCAGGDLKETRDPARLVIIHREIESLNARLESFPVPVIAAIHGEALGGGLELALSADIRLCSEQARFAASAVRMGRVALTQRLPRLIGVGPAKELIFTARRVDAAEAYRLGIVTYVGQSSAVTAKAAEVADAIASASPVAVRLAKRAIREGADTSLAAALELQEHYYAEALTSQDAVEAIDAFNNGRPAVFASSADAAGSGG